MLGRTDRRLRLVVLLAVLVLFAGALTARLAYWQLGRASDLREMARQQLERSTAIQPPRGDILDRRGTVLATTAYRDLLSAYPERIPEARRGEIAERLASILGLDAAAADTLRASLAQDVPYVVVSRQLTLEQSEAVRQAVSDRELTGLALEPRAVRLYPNPGGAPGTTLASQLLGFVGDNGQGHYGIEQRYHDLLAGRPRIVTAMHDGSGRSLDSTARVVDAGADGADLQLTIDASLQLQVEKELYAAWVADRSVRVSSVVIDPDNGEVLAWASVPGYDANAFGQVARDSADLFSDPIASQVYEPGSVMKMFTAAAALENGTVTPQSVIRDTAALRMGNLQVRNADRRAMGDIPFEDVIAYSRNVGTAKVAMNLGNDLESSSRVLYATWHKFGIGQRTGIDVGGEVPGLVADPATDPWEAIDLANRSFGQGVAVTPVQLASSFATMVNGGTRVQPHLLRAVGADEMAVQPGARVITQELSAELRRLMTHVVTEVPYYAEGSLIPGYTVGGKTGTGQIWDVKRGDWMHNTYNFSFAGFVGQERPEAVVVTRIHQTQPRVVGQGAFELGITSYELFRRVSHDVIGALDIPSAAAPGRPGASGSPDARPGRDGDAEASPRASARPRRPGAGASADPDLLAPTELVPASPTPRPRRP